MKKQYFIFGSSFFFSLGTNIMGFSLIFRLTDRLFFTPGQIGVYIALGQFFYFIGCNLYHRFGSAFEPIKIFPAAAVVIFLASIPIGFAKSIQVIYASYWILQLCTGLYWPPVMAWLTSGLSGKELNREISFFNRSWMAAIILGPLAAGSLYKWNSDINFVILIACYLTVLVLLFSLFRFSKKHGISLNESSGPVKASIGTINTQEVAVTSGAPLNTTADRVMPGEDPKPEPQDTALAEKMNISRYKGWINAFSSSLLLGIFANIVPLHIRDGLGFTEQSAGAMLFLRSICGFAGFSIMARFTAWQFNRRWFYFLQSGIIACSLMFLVSGGRLPVLYAAALFVGLFNSGCYNNSIFYSGTTGSSPKKNLALHEIFLSIGSAAGSAGGGFFYQHFRFGGTFVILTLVLLLMSGAIVLLDRYEAKQA